MEVSQIKTYTVFDRLTGKLLVTGTAKHCAAKLDMQYKSFLTMASRSVKKKTRYQIDVCEDMPGPKREAIASWNRAIYVPNQERKSGPYPCRRCPRRSLCDAMDARCKDWSKWYAAAYDGAAKRISSAEGSEGDA